MLKKMIPYTEGYRKWIFLGVLCSVGEAVFELLLPLIMADIVDVGIATGNRAYILAKGAEMILMSLVALAMGVSAAAVKAALTPGRLGAASLFAPRGSTAISRSPNSVEIASTYLSSFNVA